MIRDARVREKTKHDVSLQACKDKEEKKLLQTD